MRNNPIITTDTPDTAYMSITLHPRTQKHEPNPHRCKLPSSDSLSLAVHSKAANSPRPVPAGQFFLHDAATALPTNQFLIIDAATTIPTRMPMTISSIDSATAQYLDHRSSAYTRDRSTRKPFQEKRETHLPNDPNLFVHHLPLLLPLHPFFGTDLPCLFCLIKVILGFEVDPEDGDAQHP